MSKRDKRQAEPPPVKIRGKGDFETFQNEKKPEVKKPTEWEPELDEIAERSR